MPADAYTSSIKPTTTPSSYTDLNSGSFPNADANADINTDAECYASCTADGFCNSAAHPAVNYYAKRQSKPRAAPTS